VVVKGHRSGGKGATLLVEGLTGEEEGVIKGAVERLITDKNATRGSIKGQVKSRAEMRQQHEIAKKM